MERRYFTTVADNVTRAEVFKRADSLEPSDS